MSGQVSQSGPQGSPDWGQLQKDQQKLGQDLTQLANDTAALEKQLGKDAQGKGQSNKAKQSQGSPQDAAGTQQGQKTQKSATVVGTTASDSLSAGQAVIHDVMTVAADVIKCAMDILPETPELEQPDPNTPANSLSEAAKGGNAWLAPNSLTAFLISYQKAIISMMLTESVQQKSQLKLVQASILLAQAKASAIIDSAKQDANKYYAEAAQYAVMAAISAGTLAAKMGSKVKAESELKNEAAVARKAGKSTPYGQLEDQIGEQEKIKGQGNTFKEVKAADDKKAQLSAQQSKLVDRRSRQIDRKLDSASKTGEYLTQMSTKLFEATFTMRKAGYDAEKTQMDSYGQITDRAYSQTFDKQSEAAQRIGDLVQSLIKLEEATTQMMRFYNQ